MVLCSFLNKVGVSQKYAEEKVPGHFAVPSKGSKEILSLLRFYYKNKEEHGTSIVTEKFLPKENPAHKEIYKAVMSKLHKGEDWSTTDVEALSSSYSVSEELVRNVFEFQYTHRGDEKGLEKRSLIDKVENYISKTWDVKRNSVLQKFECKKKNESVFKDVNIDSIHRALQKMKFKFSLLNLKSLLNSDFVKEYDPFAEYFSQLPKWDGKRDYIKELSSYVKTSNQENWEAMLKKALCRSIACAVDHKENRMVMVLVSPKQELGKSTFIRFLNPFGNKYYTEAPIREDKDTEFRFAENFIYNIEELATLNNRDVNSLKAIISKSLVKERKPYAVDETEQPRRATLWGSTNREDFLTDSVNTRWLCIEVEEIDWDYKKNIDINMVWAQTYALYKEGETGALSLEERNIREAENKVFEVATDESELLLKYFSPVKADDKDAVFMPVVDILKSIAESSGYKGKLNRFALGRALTSSGFIPHKKKKDGLQVRGYYVKNTFRDFNSPTTSQIF